VVPYCNAQLSAFQRSLDSLADADISVVAMSVDDEATTLDLIARHGLRFPVGHSADAAAIAHATGAFANPDPPYLQSTGFVLDPAAGSSSACTPAVPSAGSSPRTSSAWSATSANTPKLARS
jgi:peroxiredoxin